MSLVSSTYRAQALWLPGVDVPGMLNSQGGCSHQGKAVQVTEGATGYYQVHHILYSKKEIVHFS